MATPTKTTTPKINPVKAALINKNLDALTTAKQDYEAAQANADKLKTALDNITAQRSAAIKAKDSKASTALYQQLTAAQKDYNAALGKSKQLQAIEKRATSTYYSTLGQKAPTAYVSLSDFKSSPLSQPTVANIPGPAPKPTTSAATTATTSTTPAQTSALTSMGPPAPTDLLSQIANTPGVGTTSLQTKTDVGITPPAGTGTVDDAKLKIISELGGGNVGIRQIPNIVVTGYDDFGTPREEQQGTKPEYYNKDTGAAVDPSQASKIAIAEGLVHNGVTSTQNIGVRQVPNMVVTGYDDFGTPREEQQGTKPEYYNKSTNQTINPSKIGMIGNGTAGLSGGDMFFNLTSDKNGNVSFAPQWSPRSHGFLRDNPLGQAIMALGSIIPSPIQPFVAAAKGADSLAHGNVLGGLVSLVNAGISGAGLLGGGADVVGSDWATSAAGTGAATIPADIAAGSTLSTLKDIAGGLKTANTATNVVNALEKGNVTGALTALTSSPSLAGGIGSTPIGDTGFTVGDAGKAASLAANLASGNPNIGAALNTAGSLLGSSDLSNAGKAVSLATNLTSNNPNIGAALNTAGSLFGNSDLSTAGKIASLGQGIMSGNPTSALNSIAGLGNLFNTGSSAATTTPTTTAATTPSADTNIAAVAPSTDLNTGIASVAPTTTAATTPSTDTNVAAVAPSTDLSTINTTGTANTNLGATNAIGTAKMEDDGTIGNDLLSYLNNLDWGSGPLSQPITTINTSDTSGNTGAVTSGDTGAVTSPVPKNETTSTTLPTVEVTSGWRGGSDVIGEPTLSGLEPGYDPTKEAEAEFERYLRATSPEQTWADPFADIPTTSNKVTNATNQDFGTILTGDSTPTTDTFGSQWQTVGSDRILVHDDGTATGINTETGETYTLSPKQVDTMVANNQIDTSKSGYFPATGGNTVAPGGGITATLKNGATGTLLPNKNVINPDTGVKIGTASDVVSTTLGSADPTQTQTSTITRTPTGSVSTGTTTGTATTPAKPATTPEKPATSTAGTAGQGTGLGALLPLLLMLLAANQNKGSSAPASSATIPALTATQTQTPYTSQTQAPTYRPGQGGITYFNPVQYAPKMAAGGIAGLGAASGRFLRGAGDGVSDSIPATIGRDQPARLARGEFVVDARTVAELGNGSSEAGADKLLNMMKRVHQARKKVGRGEDSHADRYLPA
jgi:hypothetical protein